MSPHPEKHDIAERVVAAIREYGAVPKRSKVTPATKLSLDDARTVLMIESLFQIFVTNRERKAIRTVGDVIRLVSERTIS